MNTFSPVLRLIVIIGLLIFSESVISQVTNVAVIDSTAEEPNKLKFGMGFGLNFVGGTNISLSPNLTYNVSEKVGIGVGLQGSYAAIKDLQNTTTFGGNIIAQYSPIKKITTLIEFVELNVTTKTETPTGQIKETYWDSALFVGAGYNITAKIAIGAKYNLLYDEDESVYTSPVLPFVNITF
ncbi:alpha-ketoglutarate decarboxylase [Sediminicola sp. 1XM1-17]|uniref:alpha-ketoglutarate decarboxylase n=1 Tax=Sediminicola sp. 1XM1-17 TaxID=3127702 RepID=UPI0030772DD7